MRRTFDHLRIEWRDAWRRVRHYPLAATVAIVSLGAGIGAGAATLLVRDAVFRNPPPLYQQPGQLMRVLVHTPDGRRHAVPGALAQVWMEDRPPALGLGAATPTRGGDARAGERIFPAPLQRVTPGLFPLLGVDALVGRTFDRRGSPADAQAAVLAHRVWLEIFGGRADAIGQTVVIDGEPCTVIGVMPPRFWVDSTGTGVWRLLDPRTLASSDGVEVLARRAPAVTEAAAASQLARTLAAATPRLPESMRDARVTPASVAGTPLGRQVAPYVVWLLGAAVGFTLLIACTNVAVLMLAQWTLREQEVAIRASLGASRASLVRALLSEAMLLAVAGGALGVATTFALRGLLVARLGGTAPFDLSLDRALLWQTPAIVLGAGLLAGLAPALYETRRLALSPRAAAHAHERVRQRFRHALVVFEIAVTGALLVVTGALVSAWQRTLAYDPGFDPRRVIAARVSGEAGLPFETLLERARRMPGVRNAALSNSVPMAASGPDAIIGVDVAGTLTITAERAIVSPDYLALVGLPVRRGRALPHQDGSASARVALVNDIVAQRLWPAGGEIGRQIYVDGVAHEVVGRVAARAETALGRPRATLYVPLAQMTPAPTHLEVVVLSAGDASRIAAPLRAALASAPGTRVLRLATLRDVQRVAGEEILATVFPLLPLIATAVLLAATGIYGVLAFAMSRRARELAVRLALGASRRDIVSLVAAQGLRLVGAGAVCGIGATWLLTRAAQGAGGVFDRPGWATFGAAGILLAVIGIAATWLPARRAMRLDPAAVLRQS